MKLPISVLLVDNLQDGLAALHKSLNRKYETVVMAQSQEEALGYYEDRTFDFVIVALEMDGNEGYRTITAIADANPDQRILTYSAEPEKPSSNVSCEVCMRTNRRHRIRKPIRLEELYDELEHFDERVCHEARTG